MLLLNFGHPLTDKHLGRLADISGSTIDSIHPLSTHFDQNRSFEEQIRNLLDTVPLSPQEWQITPFLVNPPSLSPILGVLLAEIHGRAGYFPPLVRLKPMSGAIPPQFEVAEILNLQAIRDKSRARRH